MDQEEFESIFSLKEDIRKSFEKMTLLELGHKKERLKSIQGQDW